MKPDIDSIIEAFDIRYVFVESGDIHLDSKYEEIGEERDLNMRYWVELSWGSGEKDEFDFAFAAFGKTIGEAITKCIDNFYLSNEPQCLVVKSRIIERRGQSV